MVDVVTDRVDAANAQLAEVAFNLRNKLMHYCQANLLQIATFVKAKESLKLRAPIPQLLAAFEQGTRTSIKRKTPEVEKVDPAISTKDVKSFAKKFVKTVAKKTTAKKQKTIEVKPDASIEEAVSLVEDLDDTTTLSTLMREVDQKRQTQAELIEA